MNYITVGCAFGDEGKGSVVDYLCRTHSINYVVRYCGGHQCGHFVKEHNGQSHIFSQFGSGTLANVPTYYGPYCIFEPFAWEAEKHYLRNIGITPVFYLDDQCLITTPYHAILNQLKELGKSNNEKHGSCGVGIGETRSYYLTYGQDAIIANDLFCSYTLLTKLRLIYFRLLEECKKNITPSLYYLINEFNNFSPEFLTRKYTEWNNRNYHIVMDSSNTLVTTRDNIVFEGSQGVLLDENYGYKSPHITWSTTTPKHAFDFIEHHNLNKQNTEVIGVVKSYMTRHGQGPFPSEMSLGINNDNGTEETIFNGKMRYGLFDFDLFKYFIDIAKPNCIFLNCLDEYPGKVYISGKIENWTKDQFLKRVNDYCPIKWVGYGPTAKDKVEYVN